MIKVHAEIEYLRENGDSVHSDICPPDCDFNRISVDYRQLLHDILDEWLDKSNGTGIFYVGSELRAKLLQEHDSE